MKYRMLGPKSATLAERLDEGAYPEPNSGCWLWTGTRDQLGYGHISVNGKCRAAHREMYKKERGEIPGNLPLDHLCRVPSCVNPAHLEPVTHRENILRGFGIMAINARKTHCVNGHEFTPENTGRQIKVDGRDAGRFCRTCVRESSRRSFQRRRAAQQAAS